MITVTYHYWINFLNAAGQPDAERVKVEVDFDTTDQDHAIELAERFWVEPAGFVPGTLCLT